MKGLLQPVQAPVAGFVLNDRAALYSDSYGYYGKVYHGHRYCGYAYYRVDDHKKKHTMKSCLKKLLNQRCNARVQLSQPLS